KRLGSSPVVYVRHLVYARDRTVRSAAFFGEELAANIGERVLLQRGSGITALLRAVMNESVFANVEISCPSPAAPLVRPAIGDVVLEPIEARIVSLLKSLHL